MPMNRSGPMPAVNGRSSHTNNPTKQLCTLHRNVYEARRSYGTTEAVVLGRLLEFSFYTSISTSNLFCSLLCSSEMAISTFFVVAILTRCLGAQTDLIVPFCAVGCISNKSRAPLDDQTCAPADITCLCLNTWWLDVHDCAIIKCDPDDAQSTDKWARERCMNYPSPLPSYSTATPLVTSSKSVRLTSSSSRTSPPTGTSATPSSTSRVISMSSDPATASVGPSDPSCGSAQAPTISYKCRTRCGNTMCDTVHRKRHGALLLKKTMGRTKGAGALLN
ncbi:hypothetical protein FB567DRAFT_614164 [Paraphoma chrysanthemicola]|uniref:CFEM domain-containing protein n=1 Tax=Paraphoma chrysanthemicola TaxID=798071 RepID=A0A8K0RDU9_9PLEO|nr:hypothetical protein FB567DRAFT_614164 [Paraphoma chrysanthemicola]